MDYIIDHTQHDTKADFLWYIYNKLGYIDLKLICSYKTKDGEIGFSKWIPYTTLMSLDFNDIVPGTYKTRDQFIKECSHRTILDIETMLDIDDAKPYSSIKEKATAICKNLKNMEKKYSCYWTGSKSYHISMLFPEFRLWNKEAIALFKKLMLNLLDVDTQKTTGMPIALEGERHYKSGVMKQKVTIV